MNITRITKYAAPALLLGLVFFSCKKTEQPKPPPPSVQPSPDFRVVATVNGDPITLAEFRERFARAGLKPEGDAELEVKEEFLNRLIERKMMLSEAQRKRIKIGLPEINKRIETLRAENGLDVEQTLSGIGIDFEKWKADVWEDIMIERLLNREVHKRVSVTASEIKYYYQQNLAQFVKPDQVRVRQIVVASEAEAKKVFDLLKTRKDFAGLARARSTAPEAEKGGDLGYFGVGEMPTEFNIVFRLPKGAISEIVKSPYGYHIFKIEDHRKAGRISLEEADKEIREKLLRGKEDKRYKAWMRELRSRTKFEVNYQVLQQQAS